eukprot:474679-Pleurochrysis_carterae.AAC.1
MLMCRCAHAGARVRSRGRTCADRRVRACVRARGPATSSLLTRPSNTDLPLLYLHQAPLPKKQCPPYSPKPTLLSPLLGLRPPVPRSLARRLEYGPAAHRRHLAAAVASSAKLRRAAELA